MNKIWQLDRLPQVRFGAGAAADLPRLLQPLGRRVLLVTGERSFDRQPGAACLLQSLAEAGFEVWRARVSGEPSPEWVDACVAEFCVHDIEVVLAIGGGSALDAAKAVAGLLATGRSVMDFLEGVGPELPYPGPALPFVAMPTTAGTGSEATKNAVLSRQGAGGFKKSFRHATLMPVWALVDPEWMLSLPAQAIAANGLDAITQLLEGYVSANANPLTDALALEGLRRALPALPRWYANPQDLAAASDMAYAALVSGMVLAHAGLGAVHGMAAPLGALFPAPHGLVCGMLLAHTTQQNLMLLQARQDPAAQQAYGRYASVGRLLADRHDMSDAQAIEHLLAQLFAWQEAFALPGLSSFGVGEQDIPAIIAGSRGNSMKTNPVLLSDADLDRILRACL